MVLKCWPLHQLQFQASEEMHHQWNLKRIMWFCSSQIKLKPFLTFLLVFRFCLLSLESWRLSSASASSKVNNHSTKICFIIVSKTYQEIIYFNVFVCFEPVYGEIYYRWILTFMWQLSNLSCYAFVSLPFCTFLKLIMKV